MKTIAKQMKAENEPIYNYIKTQDLQQLNKMYKEINSEIKSKILVDPVYTLERDFLKVQILKREFKQLVKNYGSYSVVIWFNTLKGYSEARETATFEEIKQILNN